RHTRFSRDWSSDVCSSDLLVDRNTVKNAQGDLIVMSRNMKISVVDEDGKERQSFKPPFGARLKVDEKSKIKRGDRIAEWDPYARSEERRVGKGRSTKCERC